MKALALALFLCGASALCAQTPTPTGSPLSRTQLVMLGTGNPAANPERSGPSVAIVVNNTPYLVDCGPGVVRRASAAFGKGVAGLAVQKLKMLFVTHLHSDHTLGYPDLIFSPWVLGRTEALEAYGPSGLKAMTDHLLAAYSEDIAIRTDGLEHGNRTGYKVNAHEIKPGVVFKDENVTVKAFPVHHGSWKQAFGYRFEMPDKVIVLSGDCAPSESVIENCNGCDILLHEVYTQLGYDQSKKEGASTSLTSTPPRRNSPSSPPKRNRKRWSSTTRCFSAARKTRRRSCCRKCTTVTAAKSSPPTTWTFFKAETRRFRS